MDEGASPSLRAPPGDGAEVADLLPGPGGTGRGRDGGWRGPRARRCSRPGPTSVSSASTGTPSQWQRRAAALEPFGDRVRIVQGGFEQVADIVGNEGIVAILFDLGVSSPQLDRPVRGFSYWADARRSTCGWTACRR